MPRRRFCFVLLALVLSRHAFAGPVLDRVRTTHTLTCGIIKEEEDYSRATDHGNRAAFDIDMCKAVAVAILGPGAHAAINVFPDEPAGVAALNQGKIDLLPTASPSIQNTVSGLSFGPITFYDGQGMLIPNNAAVHSALDLAGKKICFALPSASDAGLRAYAARQHISYIWYPFSEMGEMEAGFFTGGCAAISGDLSQLANTRAIDKSRAQEFTILPTILRRDPLAPAYRSLDPQFGTVVIWTVNTLIEAEELGVTQRNVNAMQSSADEETQTLLGGRFGTGARLGLADQWGTNVLKAVGNYGEIFERDLGAGSPLRIDRGENRLWTQGGLMYAAPIALP